MDFLNRKKKEEAERLNDVNHAVAQVAFAPEKKPTALEILRSRRAQKMETVKRLDREIAQLDHDITYVERYPDHARVLEFIAARFEDESEPKAPWKGAANHA